MAWNRHTPSPFICLALALAGCQAPASTTTPNATPSSPPASEAPSTSPSATPTPAVSTAPVAATTVRGKVYDDAGKFAPEGAQVIAKSLDASTPFETTVPVVQGEYVINGAPVGRQLEIRATKEGWTTRVRVEVPVAFDPRIDNRNVINFGGPKDDKDPAGAAYFISNYPEIERVEPVDGNTAQPHDKLTFRLVVSETLDAANRRRLASAFTIIPNSQEALADGALLPDAPASYSQLAGLRVGDTQASKVSYRYRQNATFSDGFVVGELKWEPDNRTAVFTMDAPLKTGFDKEAEYAFLLIQQDDQAIKDASNLPLGQTDENRFGTLGRGRVIFNAIKRAEPTLVPERDDTSEKRWAVTHRSFTTFSVARDASPPRLASVLARRSFTDLSGTYDRVELTFSKPMVAYPRIASPELLSLNHYILTAAPTQEAVDGRVLRADGKATILAPGSGYLAARDAINSEAGMVAGAGTSRMPGGDADYVVAVSTKDPKVIYLYLPPGSLPLDADYIKAFAGFDPSAGGKPIADPAGNPVDPNGNQASGPIY